MENPQSAYIHIPFCSHICYYCDFTKVLLDGQPVDDYIEQVIREFNSYRIKELKTLYIGGGTPSVLSPSQMSRLLSALTQNLDLSELQEFTVEANPGDLSDELIKVLADSPVNRVSLGVQTFNDELLKKIGRSHKAEDVYQSIDRLHQASFENLTIDLIYGLPNQSLDMVKEDVGKFLALKLPHIALYSLILENHTLFMNQQRRGMLNLPSDDKNAEMYEYIMKKLAEEGYVHYEISNFSRAGFESRHNLVYWNNDEYYGIGAGASGYLNGIRYKNHGPIHHYLEAKNKKVSEEKLSKKQKVEEEMFLGLRKATGVSVSKFERKFKLSFEDLYGKIVKYFLDLKLLGQSEDSIYLTEKGFELGNEVFEKFLLDKEL